MRCHGTLGRAAGELAKAKGILALGDGELRLLCLYLTGGNAGRINGNRPGLPGYRYVVFSKLPTAEACRVPFCLGGTGLTAPAPYRD